MTNGRTAAGFLVEQTSSVRVIAPEVWRRRAMAMMTGLGTYLIGIGIFSTVDAERRSELLSQYTAADSRWQKHVEQARSEAWTWA